MAFIGPKRPARLEVVLTSVSDDARTRQAVSATALSLKKKLPGTCLAFCAPGTDDVAGAQQVMVPAGCGASAALVAAANASPAKSLLFWPATLPLQMDLVRALLPKADEGAWVLIARGAVPALADALQRALQLPGDLDLGGPLMAPREGLQALTGPYGPGDPWLALRLLRKVNASSHDLLAVPSQAPGLTSAQALGLAPESRPLRLRRATGLAVALGLIFFGIKLERPAGLAVASVGIGILLLGHHFGKAG